MMDLYELALLAVILSAGYWGIFFLRRQPHGTPLYGAMLIGAATCAAIGYGGHGGGGGGGGRPRRARAGAGGGVLLPRPRPRPDGRPRPAPHRAAPPRPAPHRRRIAS